MAEPPITVRARKRSAGTNLPVHRVVIHTTSPPNVPYPKASAEGTAHSTALYFQTPAAGGSAHYIVDVAREEHCVEDNQIAHHAPPNKGSIGIEICGQPSYTREQWLSDKVWPAVERARGRAVELCARFNLPWKRVNVVELRAGQRGLCGHVDVSQAYHQSDHYDPGPNFPWDEFMAIGAQQPVPARDFPQETDVPAPTDKVRYLRNPHGPGGWKLQADGGVFAEGGAPGFPPPYAMLANDGAVYEFPYGRPPDQVWSYPGLPAEARQGSRYFTDFWLT